MNVDQLVQVMDEVGKDRARNRDTFSKLASFMGSKFHKLSKPKNIAHFTTEALVALIPVPGVGTVLVNLENKAADKFREKWRAKKRAEAGDIEGEVKFAIKELDISELDRARYKTVQQREQYNKECVRAEKSDMCVRAFWLAYRYRRWQYRVRKMAALAAALKVVAEDLEAWAENEEFEVQNHKPKHKQNLKKLLDQADGHPDGACGKACLYEGEGTGARNFKSFIERRAADFDLDVNF